MTLRSLLAGASALALSLAPASAQIFPNILNEPLTTTGTGQPLVSNGSGGVMQGTRSGTSTVYPVIDGTSTSGQCATYDSSGGLTSAVCNSGSGTVSTGTVGQIAKYTGATTVGGISVVPPANGGSLCAALEEFGGSTSAAAATNTTAFNNVIAAVSGVGSMGGCLDFGPGNYSLNTETITYPTNSPFSVTLEGQGRGTTILTWTSGNGINATIQNLNHSFHIHDLSLYTSAVNAGVALNLLFSNPTSGAQVVSDIYNIDIRGATFGTQSWATGILDQGVSFINFNSVNFTGGGSTGNGLQIQGSIGATFPFAIVFNMVNMGFFSENNGFVYGTNVQGVTLTNANFTNGVTGILVPGGETGLDQLSITNSQFNTTSNAINFATALTSFFISGNYFIIAPGTSGILCSLCGAGQIIGNKFAGNGPSGSGVNAVSATNPGLTIVGNLFIGLTLGVNCSAGMFCNLQSNTYAANGNKSNPASTTGSIFIGGGSQ